MAILKLRYVIILLETEIHYKFIENSIQQFDKNYNKLRAQSYELPSSRVSFWERGFHETKLVPLTSGEPGAVELQIRQNSRGHLLNYSARAALDCPSRAGEDQCVRQRARKFFRSLPAFIQVDGPVEIALGKTSKRWLPSHLPTIPVSPIRHNRISIDADLFIHDAGHARQIFSFAKFFSPGSMSCERHYNALSTGLQTGAMF